MRSEDHDEDREDKGPTKYHLKVEAALADHCEYFDHVKWPEQGTEEWEDFARSFSRAAGQLKASPFLARKALEQLRLKPPQFKTDHLPAFVAALEELKDGNPAQPDGQDAREPDGPCERNCTRGYLWIYRKEYDGSRTVEVDGRIRPAVAMTWCDCRLGKSMRRNCLKKQEDRDWFVGRSVPPDPSEVGAGKWADWTLYDPTCPSERAKEAEAVARQADQPAY